MTWLSAGRYAGLGLAQIQFAAVRKSGACGHAVCNEANGCSLPVACPPPRPILLHNLPLNIYHQMTKKTRKISCKLKLSNEQVCKLTRMIPCAKLMSSQHSTPHGTASKAQGSSLITKLKAKVKHFHTGVPPNTTLDQVCRALYATAVRLMKVGKVSSHNKHTGSAPTDELDKEQGPVPGNTEASPVLQPYGQVSDPANIELSTLSPMVHAPPLWLIVTSEPLVCNEVQPASSRL